jgi:hypothetical protein
MRSIAIKESVSRVRKMKNFDILKLRTILRAVVAKNRESQKVTFFDHQVS